MDSSVAPTAGTAGSLETPAWKTIASHVAALATAILFLSAGIWKIMDPFNWISLVEQLKVPYQLSTIATILLGISETLAGVLVLVPRFRRWGAMLAALLLVVFMIYIGLNYNELVGKDCSCFPWMKRAINAAFFYEDAAMLVFALIAWVWSRRPETLRTAVMILAVIGVFSGVSYGINAARLTGTKAPESITVNGQPLSLQQGRTFIYFFDPQCSHCEAAAKKMSTLDFGSTRVVSVPTQSPHWAASFLNDTHFKSGVSNDLEPLKKVFPFRDPPYGVVIENGRQKGVVSRFEDDEPTATLKKLGAIE